MEPDTSRGLQDDDGNHCGQCDRLGLMKMGIITRVFYIALAFSLYDIFVDVVVNDMNVSSWRHVGFKYAGVLKLNYHPWLFRVTRMSRLDRSWS